MLMGSLSKVKYSSIHLSKQVNRERFDFGRVRDAVKARENSKFNRHHQSPLITFLKTASHVVYVYGHL